jgi:hypothetical protein
MGASEGLSRGIEVVSTGEPIKVPVGHRSRRPDWRRGATSDSRSSTGVRRSG